MTLVLRWTRAASVLGWLTMFITAPAHALADPDGAWLARAQQELALREYQASENGLGLQAPNRAQGFRSYFDETGVRLVAREADSTSFATLRWVGLGRIAADAETQLEALGSALVVAEPRQVTQRWSALHVDYRNQPEGLHQDAVLQQPPAGSGRVTLAVDSSANLEAAEDADQVLLQSAHGQLRLEVIGAEDAHGLALAVTLAIKDQQLQLSFDDAAAHYPVRVKTLLTGTADAVLQSNQTNAQSGYSVASAGDVNGDGIADMIVGAYAFDNGQVDEGAAFVYFGSAGVFDTTFDAQLESNQTGAQLGYSVASAGDVNGDGFGDVIVGAVLYDNGHTNEGAAFVWFGGAGAFNTTADAQLEPDQPDALLGTSVAGAGDVNGDGFADVIVGSDFYDNGQSNEGAAFVWFGGAGAFNLIVDAQLEANQAGARLGYSVAGAGDVNADGFADVIVGAFFFDNGQTDEGAAFIWFGGAGVFDPAADAQLESNQAEARMGYSVAGAGDVNGDGFADVIVGAALYDNGQFNEGAAFIYFGGAGAFNASPDALLESNYLSAQTGFSVAGAGDINGDGFADVIVGAPTASIGQANEGAIFVWFGGAGVFDSTADAIQDSNQVGAELGSSVAGAGDVNGDGFADVIAGAWRYDDGQTDEGAAFVYFGGAGRFQLAADTQLETDQAFADLGVSVAGAGDVNGDGFVDVIVGAAFYDIGQTDEGAAFVYFGGAGAFDTTADALLESNQTNAQLGGSVAGAGDVNSDGFADVIVGASGFDNGQTEEGAAFVYFGGAGAFNTAADALLESNQVSAQLGVSVAGAGDVNGDGFADVIVGVPLLNNGQTREGAAFVYFGGFGAFNTAVDAVLESNQADARLGNSVAGAGDVNGDGFADVIIGAESYDHGSNERGAAFVWYGGAGSFDVMFDALLRSTQLATALGRSVAGAGDVNGDGFADVIVGAPTDGGTGQGAAYVWFGGAGAFDTSIDARLESNQFNARLGFSVASAGDVNGDGFADVIVGAPFVDNGQSREGAAFVYFGGVGAFNTAVDAVLESNQANARLGFSVAGAGDVNGDGFADVIVGAIGFENGQTDEGAAFIYHGTARGRLVRAEQFRGDGSAPVQAWGLSQQPDGFVATLNATSPRGRERARLQLEACPSATPFGSPLCSRYTAGSWTTLSDPLGTTLTARATGLTANRLYHWRARVQYAPLHGTPPVSPTAGPWRRLQANADVADIRTSAPPSPLIFANGFE